MICGDTTVRGQPEKKGRTAYIVSLKFAPGLAKEFFAVGEGMRRRGMEVRYLLAEPYRDFAPSCAAIDYVTVSTGWCSVIVDTARLARGALFKRAFAKYPPGSIVFYNTHPLNPLIASLMKREYPDSIVVLYLHDPYKPDKSSYGKIGAVRILLVEAIQRSIAARSDHIVFPSEYSKGLFAEYYPTMGATTHVAPLLVPDLQPAADGERSLFSMIGRMGLSTGHDVFVRLVNYAAENSLPYEFALVTSGSVARYLSYFTPQARRILQVVHHDRIGDEEIDVVLRGSCATFRLAREVTQSGVVPVAFRCRTPVIGTDIPGLRQHISHKNDGYLVPNDCGMQDLVAAMEYVKGDFERMSGNARRRYEDVWSPSNWGRYYGWLVEEMGDGGCRPTIEGASEDLLATSIRSVSGDAKK